MARPSGAKVRCSGLWTEAKFTNFIKNLLRSGQRKWKPMQDCIKNARTRRGFYHCAECEQEVPATFIHPTSGRRTKNIIADHIEPVIDPAVGFTTWDEFIERLFVEDEHWQALCWSCHKIKTSEETQVATNRRREEKSSAE